MPVITIAACLLMAREAEWGLPAACDRARSADARLIGVHPCDPFTPFAGAEASIAPYADTRFPEWQEDGTTAVRAVDHLTDEELSKLRRGGHDFRRLAHPARRDGGRGRVFAGQGSYRVSRHGRMFGGGNASQRASAAAGA